MESQNGAECKSNEHRNYVMGEHPNIGFKKFPKQGRWLNKRCLVCFYYNTDESIPGTIVRDDDEEPGLTIIKLADGRYVEAAECQYRVILDERST